MRLDDREKEIRRELKKEVEIPEAVKNWRTGGVRYD